VGIGLSIGAIAIASAFGFAYCDLGGVIDLEQTSAEAMVMHTPEVWPPVAGDLDQELAATELRRIDASTSGDDAGPIDAGPVDAGPPIALPDESELSGIQARRGYREGFHYIEVVLGEASFDDPLPIAFIFHGRGAAAQLPGGPFLSLSHPIRVIIPQASDRLGHGWTWIPVSVGSGLIDRLASSLFQVSSHIAQFIRSITSDLPTIGRPIVTGFSQGGLIAYSLALHHDDVVGAAFLLSTWLPPPLEPLYKRGDLQYPPMRAMHGTNDPIIPIGPTRVLASRLHERGFDIELEEFAGVGHEMSPEMNELFHRWIERALCNVLAIEFCPGAVAPGEDAGMPLVDAGLNTELDAGPPDAGRRRRRRP
jgi:phospholipase/carboxylesterase